MPTTLERLKQHKRVHRVTEEPGMIFVYLAEGWSRYGTGPVDGTSKSFCADEGWSEKGREYTMAELAAQALKWVRQEVYDYRNDPEFKNWDWYLGKIVTPK